MLSLGLMKLDEYSRWLIIENCKIKTKVIRIYNDNPH